MNVAVHPADTNILSLCTGGYGLDFGVELAIPSARTVCMVEREAFAVAHLVSAMQKGLLAQSPVWSDARTFDGRPWRGLVDGLIGGIPCQPHSMAGKKLGQDDERDLWSPARRIIVQARPWFVLIENVAGMLVAGNDKIAGAERVWRDLQRLGFSVEGGLFSAEEVGAPHERARIFILGLADADGDRRQQAERGQTQIGRSDERQPDVDDANGAGSQGRRDRIGEHPGERPAWPPGPGDADGWARFLRTTPGLEPSIRRMADGMANGVDTNRVDRLRLLGNGVVPLAAAHAIRTLAARLASRNAPVAAKLIGLMGAAE